jgi:NADH-quinone oxidoreductase subunit C
MTDIATLSQQLQRRFAAQIDEMVVANSQITLEVPHQYLHEMCLILRDDPAFKFEQLIDVCGVDYLCYGLSQWATEETTLTGFSRAVMGATELPNITPPLNSAISTIQQVESVEHEEYQAERQAKQVWPKPRFAAVYHLLSVSLNHRVRLRAFLNTEEPSIDSVTDIWSAADWFEREAFDLYGIIFKGHPDLRRILTDYGFVGHPFRKDFPLIGNVEIRYDAAAQRCVYEPVSIQPRTLVPKVIRDDNRNLDYLHGEEGTVAKLEKEEASCV